MASPSDFTGLEKFMTPFMESAICGNLIKQALLEYYYEIGIEPPHTL